MTNFLTEIFNHSLSAGYFPNSYKHATMTLIPKAGTSGTAVKDKRPISLLNVDGKLLDKILNKRLYTFLEENNLQNERQHGFRRFRIGFCSPFKKDPSITPNFTKIELKGVIFAKCASSCNPIPLIYGLSNTNKYFNVLAPSKSTFKS